MNSLTTKALMVLLSMLVILMIASQIYYRVNEKHRTEEAVLCDINENIPFKGVVVRNETVVNYSGGGVYEFLYKDGSKITSGNTIAEVYQNETALQNKLRADRLYATVDMLEKAQNPGTSQNIQPDALSDQIASSYKEMMTASVNGEFSQVAEKCDDVTEELCIYHVVSGKVENYNSQISDLRQEADNLANSTKMVNTIETDANGYFVSYCDGYEGLLNTDNVFSLSKSDVDSIVSDSAEREVSPKAIGKVFDDYSCYIIGVIPSDSRIVKDDNINVMTSTSNIVYKMKVESIEETNEEGKSLLILSCNRMDKDLLLSRVLSLDIVFDNFQGIKVSREAIRFKDGQKGVYVILGNEVTFKKIEVIYEGSDYVVSKNTADEDYLLLYDQILLEAVSQDVDSGS